jgi:hypothetical protein
MCVEEARWWLIQVSRAYESLPTWDESLEQATVCFARLEQKFKSPCLANPTRTLRREEREPANQHIAFLPSSFHSPPSVRPHVVVLVIFKSRGIVFVISNLELKNETWKRGDSIQAQQHRRPP